MKILYDDDKVVISASDINDLVAGHSIYYNMPPTSIRSEEHTSELVTFLYLVCRLLLEKKKKIKTIKNKKQKNKTSETHTTSYRTYQSKTH